MDKLFVRWDKAHGKWDNPPHGGMKKMLPNPPDLFFLVSITSSLLIMPLRQGVKLLQKEGFYSSGHNQVHNRQQIHQEC